MSTSVISTPTGKTTAVDVRFTAFTESLKSKIELDAETLEILHVAINQVYGASAPVLTVSTTGSTKKVSGWNCYMKEQMGLLKGNKRSGADMLKEIGGTWKALPKDEQAKYGAVGASTVRSSCCRLAFSPRSSSVCAAWLTGSSSP